MLSSVYYGHVYYILYVLGFPRLQHCFFGFGLVVFDDKSVSYSEFSPVGIAHDNASCRAAGRGRLSVVASGATSTSVDEEGRTTTHLALFLGLEVE